MEITLEQKKAIVKERITSLIEDLYKYELNYRFSVEQNQEESAEGFKGAMEGTKEALAFHERELATLEG